MNANIQNNFCNEVTNTAKDLISILNRITLLQNKYNTVINPPDVGDIKQENRLTSDTTIVYLNNVSGDDITNAADALFQVQQFLVDNKLYEQLFALIG